MEPGGGFREGRPPRARRRVQSGSVHFASGALAIALGLAVALVPARSALAEAKSTPKTRAAVSVVPSGETEAELALAGGLTEVLIAHLSGKGKYVLVGSLEFNSALELGSGGAIACARDKICLGNAAARLGIKKLFAGVVGVNEGLVTLSLNLVDVGTFKTDRSTILEATNPDALFEKVPDAVDLLLRKIRPASIIVKVNVPGALVVLDDTLRFSGPEARFEDVPPGEHRVKITHEGYGEVVRRVTISEGEDKALDVELLPTGVSSRPIVLRWWFLGGIGVVVAGATTALVLYFTADRIEAGIPIVPLE